MDAEQSEVTPERLVASLCKLLTVSAEAEDRFIGKAVRGGTGRVFGGQVIGQGLVAAGMTVEDRLPHSLHAYFLRAGDNSKPVSYRVERDFDGGSFSNRRVIAMQEDRAILNMTISFHRKVEGFEHGSAMPAALPPEELETEAQWVARHADELPEDTVRRMLRPRPIEMRPVEPRSKGIGTKREPAQQIWMRTAAAMPQDASQLLQRAILAYFSDMALMSTSIRPHGVDWSMPGFDGASIDHAVWFHEDVCADAWMLYAMDSPWAAHCRGMNRGQIFTRDGRLLASVAQECLIRYRPPESGGNG